MINKNVIVAGHTCLDMTPDLSSIPEGQFKVLLEPGSMIHARGFTISPGGAVPNTGLSLHKLGVPVRLIGKLGKDLFGQAIQDLISDEDPRLICDLIDDPSVSTSFTIIFNPPGFDRTFIHSHGANDTFYASDLPRETLQTADLFHFGYPPLMRSIYRGEGGELVSILQRARRAGLTTSLDCSLPDATSSAGQQDWPNILANNLPFVDLFLPSVEELLFLLQPETYNKICADDRTSFLAAVTPDLLHELSETVLAYGVKVVLIKVAHRGIYLRSGEPAVWEKGGRGLLDLGTDWHNREMWAPAFDVDVQGTCGAGDAAIAGFLAGLLRGATPETALVMASATGACSVERTDVVSGITGWEDLLSRVTMGWGTLPLDLSKYGWQKDAIYDLWHAE